jgi:hypothetical protein
MDLVNFLDVPSSLCIHGLVIDVVAKVLPGGNFRSTAHKWQEQLAEYEALTCDNAWVRAPIGNTEPKVASVLSASGALLALRDISYGSEALEGYRAYKQHLIAYQEFPLGEKYLGHTATDQERLAGRFESYSVATVNRAVFNTEDRHIALGPRTTEPGDLVVIFYGYQYPAVLRRHENEGCFFFIGPAYVYGIMDGEAVREYKARGVEDTLFCII